MATIPINTREVVPEFLDVLQKQNDALRTKEAPEDIVKTAQAKFDRIQQESPWMDMEPLHKRIDGIMNLNASVKVRARKFIQLVDESAAALAPHTPCKKGCDHCCHVPAVIMASEADLISAATGRARASVKLRHPSQIDDETARFLGKPCPFLVNHECSIYDIRPMVCRGQHSLNDTPEMCSLTVPREESFVPQHSVSSVIAVARAAMSLQEVTGDIREFFPGE